MADDDIIFDINTDSILFGNNIMLRESTMIKQVSVTTMTNILTYVCTQNNKFKFRTLVLQKTSLVGHRCHKITNLWIWAGWEQRAQNYLHIFILTVSTITWSYYCVTDPPSVVIHRKNKLRTTAHFTRIARARYSWIWAPGEYIRTCRQNCDRVKTKFEEGACVI